MRDENGFKCHCMSEKHQRQMELFGQNPDRFIKGYSEEFESSFLEHMKRTHRFSRVAATVVYNEYITNRHHVHMNSTKWATLTAFVNHLGLAGKCKVDVTPKGLFMTCIDREPETLWKLSQEKKRPREAIAEEERQEKMIAEQIERATKTAKPDQAQVNVQETEIRHKEDGEPRKVVFSMGASSLSRPTLSQKGTGSHRPGPFKSNVFEPRERSESGEPVNILHAKENGSHPADSVRHQRREGAVDGLEQVMREQERAKEMVNRKDHWLCTGLLVKVMSKRLAVTGHYKQKGVVVSLVDKYVGKIKMLDSGDVLKVDQDELETVIPQTGGMVKIVNGAYRDSNARLLAIDTKTFSADVRIEQGKYAGRVILTIDYEDICKFSSG